MPYTMKFQGRKVSWFFTSAKLLYENLRWRYSDMDLRESMWDSTKVFLQMSMCTTCRETFLPQNFHDIW